MRVIILLVLSIFALSNTTSCDPCGERKRGMEIRVKYDEVNTEIFLIKQRLYELEEQFLTKKVVPAGTYQRKLADQDRILKLEVTKHGLEVESELMKLDPPLVNRR